MRRKKILPIVIVLALISIALILLSGAGRTYFVEGPLSWVFSPIQRGVSAVFNINIKDSKVEVLERENSELRGKLKDQALLESENKALRDQFEIEYPRSGDLLPAKVIGRPGFIPGVSRPEHFILNVGKTDGVVEGKAVIFGTSLVGRVSRVFSHTSKVEIITNSSSTFTAKSVSYFDSREAIGIVKGSGNEEIVLGNVLLSSVLRKEDVVLTKGDVDETGSGFPPNLIVGKIISVEKKPSDLFQRALIESPIDFSSIDKVFVVIR